MAGISLSQRQSELVPEAILRYLMFRFYEERLGPAGPSS